MATEQTTGRRRRNSDLTRENILEVATAEFADKGLSGARVDEIAERTQTTKRMIYYYFGDKEGLYRAVLENSYGTIRAQERELDLADLGPVEAIRTLAEATFDHHDHHPDFIRIVANENMLRGEHIRRSTRLAGLGAPAVDVLTGILERGRDDGIFRDGVDALDIHLVISSFCVFRTANRYTWQALFDQDLATDELRTRHRRMLGDLVVAYLTTAPD
ncbi:TetR family transcriptional regulator [Rhodococcus indonesiensis]|uniref:TetR family transcriptional regulator n=1 Tax=Rhodococcus indonesiensis TaxID=3055869 RepID=UPI0039F6F2CA